MQMKGGLYIDKSSILDLSISIDASMPMIKLQIEDRR
jgi:hypothetical protein